jgi:NAD(P)H dehydrogenase (quinone)
MSKILVLYQSNSSHTEKMALFVYKGACSVKGAEVRLKSIAEAGAEDLKWCDGIALGAPTNFGTVPWEMKKWWDEQIDCWMHLDGKFGTVFSSSGSWGGGAELTCMTLMHILINYGILVFGITDYTGPKFSAHYGAVMPGEPQDEGQSGACERIGMRLSEYCGLYMDGDKTLHPSKQTYDRSPPDSKRGEPLLDYENELKKAKAANA